MAIAAVLAVSGAPVSATGSESTLSTERDFTSAEALADAARFRTTFGLESTPEYVLYAATDTATYSNLEWGVPLSDDEALELARRNQLETALAPAVAYAKASPEFGSFYFDQRSGGVPHFRFTSTAGKSGEIAARLPAGTPYVVEQALYSHQELSDLVSTIDSAYAELKASGIWMTSIAVDPYTNRVLVGLDAASWEKSQLLVDRFGSALTFRQHGPAISDACNGISDCWPTKGGIYITTPYDGGDCTSGFVVRRLDTNALALLTAGHCLAVHGGSGRTWKHHGNTIGTSSTYIWESYVFADAGLINISASAVTAMNGNYRQYLADPSPVTVKNLTSVGSNQFQDPGYSVCRIGWGTGNRTCGSIYIDSIIRDSCVTGYSCRHLYGQWEVDFDSTGGDSGGTVVSGAVTLAYGIHIHSDPDSDPDAHGWYSTVDNVKSTLQGERGVDIKYCITDAC